MAKIRSRSRVTGRAARILTGLTTVGAAALGLTAAPAQAAPANDLEYNYTYFLASNPPTTPQAVTRMVLDDFDTFFPFPGCPNAVNVGTICPLQALGHNNPIRVEAANATSFTFRSLPTHTEGADRMIRFTFLTDGSGNLNLNVHSWGPGR